MFSPVRTSSLIRAGINASRVRFTGARRPLAARIQVTRRCPLDCEYCHPPPESDAEMTARQILGVMEQLRALGCLRISFSGGEPMVRREIDFLVDGCAALGMAPEMNSSGMGFAPRVHQMRNLKLLKLSLDGPEKIHDRVRGRAGAYREVRRALQAATEAGIRTVLVCTITRHNVGELDHVLHLARRHGAFAAFQPIKPYYRGQEDVDHLLPEPGQMQEALQRLQRWQQEADGAVLRNSSASFDHMAHWPRYGPLKCWAGRIFCIVGTDGTLYPCDRSRIDAPLPSCLKMGVARALQLLPDPRCDGCGFCGALELNFAMAMDLRVASTISRLVL